MLSSGREAGGTNVTAGLLSPGQEGRAQRNSPALAHWPTITIWPKALMKNLLTAATLWVLKRGIENSFSANWEAGYKGRLIKFEMKQTLLEVCTDRFESFCSRETTQDRKLVASVMRFAEPVPTQIQTKKTENTPLAHSRALAKLTRSNDSQNVLHLGSMPKRKTVSWR